VTASAQLTINRMLPHAAAAGKWVSAWDSDGAVRRSSCAADVRRLLTKAAGYATLQVLFDFRDREQSLEVAAAALLITRGLYATLMWPVTGTYERATGFPWNATLLEHDFAAPLQAAVEQPAAVFSRRFAGGTARLDCNTYTASFMLGPP